MVVNRTEHRMNEETGICVTFEWSSDGEEEEEDVEEGEEHQGRMGADSN
jgi:hypothetical protein